MARTRNTTKKSQPALRSAPISGAGVVRKSNNTMNDGTTIFRLLKVPKYAKRTLATLCEQKSRALEEEVSRLREDWMEKERMIEWYKQELKRLRGELRAANERHHGNETTHGEGEGEGQGLSLTEAEKKDFETLWNWCGPRQ